ncbi:hypothetical protein C8R46DRAFT_1217837 [Mycena filopes]|nr:hypothetical protein C8R46DRAFT_1217837 [Mycena filopes]
MSSQPPPPIPSVLTQYQVFAGERSNGLRPAPAWPSKFRARVKNLSPEQQEPFKARARHARARYRET